MYYHLDFYSISVPLSFTPIYFTHSIGVSQPILLTQKELGGI